MYANLRSQTKFKACWKGRVVWVVAIIMHCVESTLHMLVVKGSREWRRTTPLKWSNWWLRGCLKSWNPKPSKRNYRGVLHVGVQHQKNSQLYARRTTFFQGQLLTCCRWRRFRWWTTQVQSDKTQRGQCLSLEFIVTFESQRCIFIIFNFQLSWRSNLTRCCWLPWCQIDARQSTELENEESEMLKPRNREKTEH